MTETIMPTISLSPALMSAVSDRGTLDKERAFNIPLPIDKSLGDAPAREIAVEQSAEPIVDEADINRMVSSLLEHGSFRNAMLLVVGVNTGLRYSDLVSLRFCDLIDEKGYFVDDVKLVEIKTRNTRGRKHGDEAAKPKPVNRHLYLNEAVRRMICLYLEHVKAARGDLLFKSLSNNGRNEDRGLSHTAVDNIFKPLTKKLGIDGRYSTHFMRKTFSYHLLMKAKDSSGLNQRSVEWLQMTLGHSSQMTTLRYAGYQSREIREFYSSLNLGLEAIMQFISNERRNTDEIRA